MNLLKTIFLMYTLLLLISCKTEKSELNRSNEASKIEKEDTLFYSDSEIEIIDPWVRVAPKGGMTAGYLKVRWKKTDKDSLIGFFTDTSKRHEIHETYDKGDGMKGMRQIDGLALESDALVELAPGGAHLMLMGLSKELAIQDSVDIRLDFKQKESISIKFPVRSLIAE